jgi:hypothetical protein
MLIVVIFGVMFLGFVFLIKGSSLILIASSLGWLIIAIIIVLYKVNQKEEKYI